MSERPAMSFLQQSEWILKLVESDPRIPTEEKERLNLLATQKVDGSNKKQPDLPKRTHFTGVEMRTIEVFLQNLSLTDKELAMVLFCSTATVMHRLNYIRRLIRAHYPDAKVDSRIELYLWLTNNSEKYGS